MPLVIISGLPCSGKTFRAQQLADYIKTNVPGKTVEIISEEVFGACRMTSYASSTTEKTARGNFISAVERRVTKDHVVIADGLNYIKGYRYQIYCIARALSTTHCVLQCVVDERQCRLRNDERRLLGGPAYPSTIFEELLLRYEEPNNQTRWDSPLFTVGPDEPGDWSAVTEALLGAVTKPPSMATTVKAAPGNSGDYLLYLERVTQELVEIVMNAVRERGVPTAVLVIPTLNMKILIKKSILMSDLQKLKRQFIHMNRLHQVDLDNIKILFAQYLENNLK